MKYFYNEEKNILVGVGGAQVVVLFTFLGEENVLDNFMGIPSVEKTVVKKAGRKPGSKNKPKDNLPKKERHIASNTKLNTSFDDMPRNPTNRDLISEFCRSAVDSIVMERTAGVGVQEMLEDRPPHCSHLTDDDLRKIFHNAEN